MKTKEAIRFVVARSLGNFLLLLSLYGVAATFYPVFYYELQYRLIQTRGIEFRIQPFDSAQDKNSELRIKDIEENKLGDNIVIATNSAKEEGGASFLDVLVGAKKQVLIPIDTHFSIMIPKIGASSKVFPNIDPVKTDEFSSALRDGIAHAKGTVFPGMGGNVYFFAHSTDNWWNAGRINAVFYLLKNLNPGDDVIVFFENVRYDYVVEGKFVADSTYVDLLSGEQKGQERVILQTCWPPGTTWKRLFVVAKPKANI